MIDQPPVYFVEFYGGDVRVLTQQEYIRVLEQTLINGSNYGGPSPVGKRICVGLRCPWSDGPEGLRLELRRVKEGEDFSDPHGIRRKITSVEDPEIADLIREERIRTLGREL